MEYGTGIVKGCPAHDERDFEFAINYKLTIKQVIKPYTEIQGLCDDNGQLLKAFEADGKLINCDRFNDLDAKADGARKIVEALASDGKAEPTVTYKLRDWVFSRQRYWGEPIPLVHCPKCGVVSVPEDQLPVLLPDVKKYEPTGTGESPLAGIDEWVKTKCPECGCDAKRETNTMPQWAGSCWYFLRYPDSKFGAAAFDKDDMDYWMPVDLYVGGIEHAVLHLLYARFYIKVLNDLGYLPFDEPFARLFNQGMVCMKSSITGRAEKMSKSKGNVVSPDEMVDLFGSDTLRMYMLFMGPPELDTEWQSDSIKGVHHFLNRLWNFLTNEKNILPAGQKSDEKTTKRFHRFLKAYQERIIDFKVNTAVSAAMEYLNDLEDEKHKLDHKIVEQFLVAMSVMVPHMASELLEKLLCKQLENCSWASYSAELAELSEVEIAIQVNGKLRASLVMPKNTSQDEVERVARSAVAKWLDSVAVLKVVFV